MFYAYNGCWVARQISAKLTIKFYIMSSYHISCVFQVKENNYRGHGDSVDQLCWHPTNPDLFVTASGDKTVRVWDVRTTKCIATVNTKGQSSCRPPDKRDRRLVQVDNMARYICINWSALPLLVANWWRSDCSAKKPRPVSLLQNTAIQ